MRLVLPGTLKGTLKAPPSKSFMQRAVIASSLAEGESLIANPTFCDDAVSTVAVMQGLGAWMTRGPEGLLVQGGLKPEADTLDCGESGTCLRMVCAIAALSGKELTITGRGTLMKRPLGMIEEPLRRLGAQVSTEGGLPPITIKGPIHGGTVSVDGSLSSQFISGLLFALPLCREDSVVDAQSLRSGDYVHMSTSVMERFGVWVHHQKGSDVYRIKGGQRYKARRCSVDGDWSGAAFLLVAGAIAGHVRVRGLGADQADSRIIDAIRDAGGEAIREPGAGEAKRSALHGFEFDATDCPDLFPPLAVLACSCEGKSVIRGASRLRYKESDRALALVEELGKLGADIRLDGDSMEIVGKKLAGGRLDPRGDHRIAMAGAIAALNSSKGVEIVDEGCVSKSYPGFFSDLESLTVR